MKNILKTLALVTVAVTMLASCGGSNLTGRWQDTESSRHYLEFFSDGTYKSDDVNYAGSYSVDGDRMRLSGILMEDITCTFKVSGDTLTIYDDDGEVSSVLKKR